MLLRFTLLVALILSTATFGLAQEAAPVTPKPTVRRAPARVYARSTPFPATPAEKKPGVFQRMFGRSKPTPAPTPAATPTPRPRPRVKKPVVSESGETPSPEASPAPKATPAPKPSPEETPETPAPKKGPKGKPTPEPKPAAEAKPETKEQAALKKAMEGGDADAIEKAKYDEAKSRAAADGKILELKQKADLAPTEAEGRKELKSYNKALFQKMRTLDPSIKERIDRMEAAVMKQLDGI